MQILIDDMYDMAHDNVVPLSIVIELLTACNERCKHCYIPEHNSMGLDTEQVKDILKQFRAAGGLNVTFTGGEIFLRKDLFELIEEARKLYLRVFLLTNATLITDEVAKKLKQLNVAEVSVSIYSMDEIEHDWITGESGSLKKSLLGIENVKKYNIPVRVKTPLMDVNRYAFYNVSKYCKENGFKFMTSAIIFAQSNGDKKTYDLRIRNNELEKILLEIKEYNEAKPNDKYEEACGALKYTLAIDCLGNIYPCNSFYYKLGNIKEDKLIDVWNSLHLKQLQNIMKTDLKKCVKCELQSKCHRCPGLAYLEDGNIVGCSSTAKNMAMITYKAEEKEGE